MFQDRLETALRSSEPGKALRALVEQFAREGYTKAKITAVLEDRLGKMRAADETPEQQEVVLDVLDAVTGWCHPSARLLTEEEG